MMGYQIVRYWGRKPLELAQRYIGLYSRTGEIVADTFGGSGIFIETALRLGRRAVYIDLNPFAELVAHSLIESCDLFYEQAIQSIISRKVMPVQIKGEKVTVNPRKLFHVKCTCKRSMEAKFVTFTRVYRISSNNLPLLNGTKSKIITTIQKKGQVTHDELCRLNRTLATRLLSTAIKWLVRQGIVKEREVPLYAKLVKACKCGRTEVRFQNENPWKIKGPIESAHWYPKDELKYNDGMLFLKKRDALSVNEFFMDRSLALLSELWHDVCSIKAKKNVKRCLHLTFMATLARSSKMCRTSGGTWPINSYWIPRNFVVKNPYEVFKNAATQMVNVLKNQWNFCCGSLESVLRDDADVTFLAADSANINLPKCSIDYVIIDPPHTDEAQFFELSLFYTSWLRKKLQFENELIINPKQGKTLYNYLKMLKEAARRIHHALKRNKYFTVILHEEDRSILKTSVETICSVGFKLIENARKGNYNVYTFRKRS